MFQAFLFTTQIALKILRGSHASNFVIKVELNIEVFTTIWEKNCHNLGFALQIFFFFLLAKQIIGNRTVLNRMGYTIVSQPLLGRPM